MSTKKSIQFIIANYSFLTMSFNTSIFILIFHVHLFLFKSYSVSFFFSYLNQVQSRGVYVGEQRKTILWYFGIALPLPSRLKYLI